MKSSRNGGPTLTMHDVSVATYRGLLEYMQAAGGVTVTEDSETASTISGADTEIRLTHDRVEQSLRTEFVDVPFGLETYYWGHAFHRILLVAQAQTGSSQTE